MTLRKDENSILLELTNNPIGVLFLLYLERRDLQESFPKVKFGNLTDLVKWAADICNEDRNDEQLTKQRIFKFADWYNEQIKDNSNQLSLYKSRIDSLNQENLNLNNQLSLYKSRIDSLNQENLNLNNQLFQHKSSIDFLNQGIGSLLHQAKEKINQDEMTVLSSRYEVINKDKKIELKKKQILHSKFKFEDKVFEKKFQISVVIPTNSDESNLCFLIDKIKEQKGISNFEIILVNSGVDKLNLLRQMSDVKIFDIPKEEFNHGKTRNLGASNATQNFIIFLTDDAIPANDNLFYDMCTELQNLEIAAVSARQIPRSDTDLMSTYAISEYNKFLQNMVEKNEDKPFDNLDAARKRRLAQIDDVCSCYKREIFSKYKYKELVYAEDLDLGIRLVKDGYKIGRIINNGVIHSHRRSPAYYLKRGFVEFSVLSHMLGYEKIDFDYLGILDEESLFGNMFSVYNSLGLAIDFIKENQSNDIGKTFNEIYSGMQEFSASKTIPKSKNSSLDELFLNIVGSTIQPSGKKSILLQNYLERLKPLENYLTNTYPSLLYIHDDLFNTLYQIFGDFAGNFIAAFIIYATTKRWKLNKLQSIERMLGGI